MARPVTQRALERMVEEHYAALYRYAYRLSGSATEAEDLTQEAFCKAHGHWHQLRDPLRAKAWLFTILRNAYLRRVRDGHRAVTVSLNDVDEIADDPPPPLPEVSPAQLQQALAELPERFRTPIILYYFNDFSYRDIAEHMGVPIGTVMSRLARAKGHLRRRLLERQLVVEQER